MDILSFAAIHIPCRQCGEPYSVPLSDILLSHKIMHQARVAPVGEPSRKRRRRVGVDSAGDEGGEEYDRS